VFDGTNDNCPITNQTFNISTGSSFTIEIAYKRNSSTPGPARGLYTMGTGGISNARIYFWFDDNSNGRMAINYYTQSGFDRYIELSPRSLDTDFHHAVQVVNKSTLLMTGYFDGVSKGSGSIESSSTSDTTFRIGGTTSCNATVAFVRIYNRALSSTEVLQNYQAQFPRFLGENIITNGLVLYLDAGYRPSYPTTGTTWYDVSGYGNNGTLTNGPTYSSSNGGSIVFDGADDKVTFGSPNMSTSCTVNQWIQPLSGSATTMRTVEYVDVNSATAVLYSQLVKSSNIWYHQVLVSGYQAGYAQEMNMYFQSNVTQFVQNNTPYNFTLTWERTPGVNSTLKTYLNGVYREQQINTNSYWSNTATLSTATYNIPSTYKGNISTTSFYNRPLSTAEILQNYNAQKSRFGL
jgi:hypothetical protein